MVGDPEGFTQTRFLDWAAMDEQPMTEVTAWI
ncbi:hypothetical protein BKA07_000566 [Brevibacterium marinum]|uniref:Uncharacterized protein n=1 Tax=Brevibacterium marinum TaxID=418643 RepID=A0A846RZZ7_9MICO|nr:hypothetical protein [Brevibacterium marinum]